MTAREKLIAEVIEAIANGQAVVTYTKCWACITMCCPGGPHPWADREDIDHAAKTGQPDPSDQSCGCPCAAEEPYVEDPPDMDLEQLDATPCTVCGEHGACAYDAEGRSLIHTTDDEDDQ